MTKVDQNGTTHTYSFDLLGRMTADAVTLASGNPQNVDSSVLRIETSHNTQGLLDTVTSFDATSGGNITNQVQNVYNGLGQLTTQYQEHVGAVNTSTSLHVDYGYSDLAHGARLASLTYPNGRVLTYNYGSTGSVDDSISRLTSISDGNTTLESYAYLGLGTVVERNHPESGANLTYVKQSGESDGDAGDQYTGLDRFSRVVDQRWIDGSGTALDRYGYTYDRNSNRLTKSNSLNGNLSESYSYDDLNRLANMTRGGSAYQSWDLDGLGNMNSVTTGNVTETRTHNAQNQLTSMGNTTLAFDNNGNTVTDDQGHTLVYDAWNRLVAVKSGATLLKSYSYDGQGWRISEAPAGGTATDLYYSSQWQVLEERQAGNATAQYGWSPVYVDALIARDRDTDSNGSLDERLYVLQDANENVTAIITTSGAVAERYVLDPYGVVSVRNADWSVKGDGTVSASTFGWVYLHQGGRFDVTANLYTFRHRDYSPTMMRWMQEDPLGYVDGKNVYLARLDNPVKWRDFIGQATAPFPYPIIPLLPGNLNNVLIPIAIYWAEEAANALVKAAMEFTEPFEGRRANAYKDTKGKVTVGVGFNMDAPSAKSIWENLLPNTSFADVYNKKAALAEGDIDTLFRYTIKGAISSAKKYVTNFDEHPTQIELVLIDMSFQLGSLARWPNFRKALADKDYCKASKEMEKSKWAKDTPNRARHHIEIVKSFCPAATAPTTQKNQ